jgi:hypothetical protein
VRELVGVAASAYEPEWTGLVTTVLVPGSHVHGDRLPVSNPGLATGFVAADTLVVDISVAPAIITRPDSKPANKRFILVVTLHLHTSIPRPSTTGSPGARGRGLRPRVVGGCHTADHEMPS